MSQSSYCENLPAETSEPLGWTENAKAVFVNGIVGGMGVRRLQAKLLSCHLYGGALGDKESKVKLVSNNARTPKQVHQGALYQVLQLLTEDQMIEGDGEDLRLIIFCHSNGVKVVKQALNDKEIKKKIEGCQNLEATCERIRKRVAVVAFGGVTIIPETAAKCVINYVAIRDHASRACLRIAPGDYHVKYVTDDEIIDFDGRREGRRIATQIAAKFRRGIEGTLYLAHLSSCTNNDHDLIEYLEKTPVVPDINSTLARVFGRNEQSLVREPE